VEKERYYAYSHYLKQLYGEKVYKLPINLPITCPNRDGKLGTGGCYFCNEQGTAFESLSASKSVAEQLDENKTFIGKKYNAKKFIAYFQNYTNTYMSYEIFESYMRQACQEDIVELDISTRPDCLDSKYLEILKKIEVEEGVKIVLEIGLQTTNEESLVRCNRQHTVTDVEESIKLIHAYGFKVCVHLILNLPWDTQSEVIRMANLLNDYNVEMVKLHALFIGKGTVFESMYLKGDLRLHSLEDYIQRVILFIGHLNPSCAIQRLIGRAPKGEAIFCNWDTSWWKIRDTIDAYMAKDHRYQGDKING